jgi:CHAT domain-containing protein
MSLWEVADEATSLLMREFYRRWLNGEGKLEAFKGAQGTVREAYPEPYYWAAFVMMD